MGACVCQRYERHYLVEVVTSSVAFHPDAFLSGGIPDLRHVPDPRQLRGANETLLLSLGWVEAGQGAR